MKLRRLIMMTVCAIALVASGCEEEHLRQLPDTRATDEAAIRAATQDWSNAASSRDLEKTVSFYADDATVNPDGAPVVTGKDGIRKVWVGVFTTPGGNLHWISSRVEVARSGDLAYDTGAYAFAKNDASGKPITKKGKYLVVWKKQADGKWKVIEDIDNADQ